MPSESPVDAVAVNIDASDTTYSGVSHSPSKASRHHSRSSSISQASRVSNANSQSSATAAARGINKWDFNGPKSRGKFTQRKLCFTLIAGIAFIMVVRLIFIALSSTSSTAALELKPELVPVFDEEFETILSMKTLDEVHSQGLPHSGAVVVVYRMAAANAKGYSRSNTGSTERQVEFLLSKRAKDLVTCPGSWMMIGEHGQDSEDPVHMTLRALREELGIYLSEEKITSLCHAIIEATYPGNQHRDHQLSHLTLVEFPGYQNVVLNEETENFRWVSPEGILRMADNQEFCIPELSEFIGRATMSACSELEASLPGACHLRDAVSAMFTPLCSSR